MWPDAAGVFISFDPVYEWRILEFEELVLLFKRDCVYEKRKQMSVVGTEHDSEDVRTCVYEAKSGLERGPRSGPAVTGPGDLLPDVSLANKTPLAAKEGYADLFWCLRLGWSSDEVSTRRAPVGGREPDWYPLGDESFEWVLVGVAFAAALVLSWLRLAEMRARSETGGSLESLSERLRVASVTFGGGAPSAPGGAPEAGSSVWMKQQRLP